MSREIRHRVSQRSRWLSAGGRAQETSAKLPDAHSWQSSADARPLSSIYRLFPLQLQKPVCFDGGGEVMLSKWTKSSGSSSSPSSSSPHAAWLGACVPARTLSQPLSAELLLHSSAPYLLLWIFIWSRAALRACLRKDSRTIQPGSVKRRALCMHSR